MQIFFHSLSHIFELSVFASFAREPYSNTVTLTVIDPENQEKAIELRNYQRSDMGEASPFSKEEVIFTDDRNNVVEGHDNPKVGTTDYSDIASYLAKHDANATKAVNAANASMGSNTPMLKLYTIEPGKASYNVSCKEATTLTKSC